MTKEPIPFSNFDVSICNSGGFIGLIRNCQLSFFSGPPWMFGSSKSLPIPSFAFIPQFTQATVFISIGTISSSLSRTSILCIPATLPAGEYEDSNLITIILVSALDPLPFLGLIRACSLSLTLALGG